MPWIALYSLISLYIGRFSIRDAVVTSLGIGNLVKGGGFNWYISFLLPFYALAPFLYRLLLRERTRRPFSLILLLASLEMIFLINDVSKRDNMLIGFTRFPIFLIGMLAGFWLKEGRGLSRAEYRSMIPVTLLLLLTAHLLADMELHSIVKSMWLCYCIAAPMVCLMPSRAFDRNHGQGKIMRFLRWTGENSLLIYVWNIFLVRFYSLFLARYLAGSGNLQHFISHALQALDEVRFIDRLRRFARPCVATAKHDQYYSVSYLQYYSVSYLTAGVISHP